MILNYITAMRETSNLRSTRLLELAIGSLTPPAGKRRIIVAVSYGFICHFIFLLAVLSMMTAMFFEKDLFVTTGFPELSGACMVFAVFRGCFHGPIFA